MLVKRFLVWSQTASAGERADGVSALARAWLYGDLEPGERRAAETALTAALDDPSPLVRRALAEVVAGSSEAPRHLTLALANDQSDISSAVLLRSTTLRDSDLIDCAAVGDTFAQTAIASRPRLSAAVAAALAEIGKREALIALAVNAGADLLDVSMKRMIERFGHDGELREALLLRGDLAPGVRHDLAVATARALAAFVAEKGWLAGERAERVTREARDKAAVIISAEASEAAGELARHLRASGHLTASLLLRALLSGDRGFVAAALADLTGMSAARTHGLMAEPRGAGFLALCAKAGLPGALAPAFSAACAATRGARPSPEGRLSLAFVSAVVDACEASEAGDTGKALALLRRFEVEAAREEARAESLRLVAAALPAPEVEAEGPASGAPAIELEAADAASDAPPVELDLGEPFVTGGAPVLTPDADTIADADPAPERIRAA
ncbi:MAG: DUF2336 domain-containing protein [Rhizobiales bacterium]|nr:DUF2336 domain-containing protein [Hyphomicrobiales bacterium]